MFVGSFKQGGVEGEDRRSLPLKVGFSFLFFENIILLEKGTMTFFRLTLVILDISSTHLVQCRLGWLS